MVTLNVQRPHPTPPSPKHPQPAGTVVDAKRDAAETLSPLGKRYVNGVDIFAAHKAKAAPAMPQTLGDIVKGRQAQVDKLDARLQQMNDPGWLAGQKSKVEQKRSEVEHEIEILKAAEGGKAA